MTKISIPCSKNNEVKLEDVKKFIKSENQIIWSKWGHGVYAGTITIDGKQLKITASENIKINNVILPLAVGPDSYFSETLEIWAEVEA